jgi:predicted transcriptional regulator
MTDSKDLKQFYLKEKPVMALVTIRRARGEIYCSIISKKIDTTYAHTVKTISRMEEDGFVRSKKKGRKKILELTPKGIEFSDKFLDLIEAFREEKNR